MSSPYQTGEEGEAWVAEELRRRGHEVERLDGTFDLRVDGDLAEVKASEKPYAEFGFVQLTEDQYRAYREGDAEMLYVVCNLREAPKGVELVEISARELVEQEEPVVERKFFYYRSQLDRLRKEN